MKAGDSVNSQSIPELICVDLSQPATNASEGKPIRQDVDTMAMAPVSKGDEMFPPSSQQMLKDSKRIEGRPYISDQLYEIQDKWGDGIRQNGIVCFRPMTLGGMAETWENERDAFLRGENVKGCGLALLLRAKYLAIFLSQCPCTTLRGTCQIALGVLRIGLSVIPAFLGALRGVVCLCDETSQKYWESAENCCSVAFSNLELAEFNYFLGCLLTTRLPGNIVAPEIQSGLFNQHSCDLRLSECGVALNESIEQRSWESWLDEVL